MVSADVVLLFTFFFFFLFFSHCFIYISFFSLSLSFDPKESLILSLIPPILFSVNIIFGHETTKFHLIFIFISRVDEAVDSLKE